MHTYIHTYTYTYTFHTHTHFIHIHIHTQVSCTGAQFCGLAIIETKSNAELIAEAVQEKVDVSRDVRIHWTGCPNSCGQVSQ